MDELYDIYLWRYPKANELIKVPNVEENKVMSVTQQWLNKAEDTDCMIVYQNDEFIATNECNITVATDEWIKQNFIL